MSKNTKKKTDKQIFGRWVLIMVLAFVGGGIGGFFSTPIAEWLKEIVSKIEVNEGIMTYVALAVFVLFNVVCIGITVCFYKKAKSMSNAWDGEDEEQIEIIEKKLDYAMLPLTIASCVNQFLFAATFYVGFEMLKKDIGAYMGATIATIVVFLGVNFLFVALQKKLVDLTKSLNPEKKGNIFDKNFSNEWLASCDEAQQLVIYKSSFQAYKAVGTACQILWLVTFVGLISFDTGLLPVFCVTVIMLVMQIAYIRESMRLERGK